MQIINDKCHFFYNNIAYIGKIISHNNKCFIITTSLNFTRIVFELLIDINQQYLIGLISIDSNHNINNVDYDMVKYYNSVEYQQKLLSNDETCGIYFLDLLNTFINVYLNKIPIDDIFLNLMYFLLTGHNRTYILCLCALNNDEINFDLILNNIAVNYEDLLYVLHHSFGYLMLTEYLPVPKKYSQIINKKIYMNHINNMQYLRYLPHYSYLKYENFQKLCSKFIILPLPQ